MSNSHTWQEKWEIRAGAWERKGGLHSEGRKVPRRRGASKKNFHRRSRSKHERMSGYKSLTRGFGDLVAFKVWLDLKWQSRLENKGPAHKMTGQNESG